MATTTGQHTLTGKEGPMQTLNEMLERHLLTPDQHFEILAWVTRAKTPERIMEMPAHLWRSLELASVLMDVDADIAPMT